MLHSYISCCCFFSFFFLIINEDCSLCVHNTFQQGVNFIQKKLKEKIRRSEECDDVKILNTNCKVDSNARVEKYKLHTRGRLVWTIYIGKTEVVFSVNRIWQKDDNWYQIWGKYQDM